MNEKEVRNILISQLYFTQDSLYKIENFCREVIEYNKKFNLISRSTENQIWDRHVLDSAQLVKFIDFNKDLSLSDLGTGAGFPGIVLAIFNKNKDFHVKLYEKSPIKRDFLNENIKKLQIGAETFSNIYEEELDSDFVVCRAFKKIDKIIQVSREIIKKPHKLIVLKGKRAQEDLNKAFKSQKYHYKIEQSITDKDSKIIIIYFN